jgi:hypothetical protein
VGKRLAGLNLCAVCGSATAVPGRPAPTLRFLYKITLERKWSLDEVIPNPKMPQKAARDPEPKGGVAVLELRCLLWTLYGKRRRNVVSRIAAWILRGLSGF